ncbi:MAG TPA: hypothetical protein VLF89_02185 [Candidatus Saccharimonadales bacterium]|nr:hypothetical protein [Candidatus Saccharimonadales bacterium]
MDFQHDVIVLFIGGFIALLIAVLFEEPLTVLRNSVVHRYKRLFYKRPNRISPSELFSFGSIKTPWMIVDGDGEGEYAPQTVITHYEGHALELPPDLTKRKKEIQKEEDTKRKEGKPFLWNGSRYYLDRFVINRTDLYENLSTHLWFKPTDYYTFLATNVSLDDEALRKKYLHSVDWETTAPQYFSNDFALYLMIITSDEYTILPKRSDAVGIYKNTYTVSLSEGLSRTLDRGTTTLAPDIYRCAIRGIGEEVGISDIPVSDITLLSFGVNTKYVQWSMLGFAKVNKTIDEILDFRSRGVRDKWENSEFNVVKFDLHEIVRFVFTHEPWAPGALANIYQVLVHEFGREKTDKAIAAFKQ